MNICVLYVVLLTILTEFYVIQFWDQFADEETRIEESAVHAHDRDY